MKTKSFIALTAVMVVIFIVQLTSNDYYYYHPEFYKNKHTLGAAYAYPPAVGILSNSKNCITFLNRVICQSESIPNCFGVIGGNDDTNFRWFVYLFCFCFATITWTLSIHCIGWKTNKDEKKEFSVFWFKHSFIFLLGFGSNLKLTILA